MAETQRQDLYVIPILVLGFFILPLFSSPAWAVSDFSVNKPESASVTPSTGLNALIEEAVGRLIEKAERYYHEGEEHVLAGRFDEARLSFDLAITTIQSADPQLRATPHLREYLDNLRQRIEQCGIANGVRLLDEAGPAAQKSAPSSPAPPEMDADEREAPGQSSLAEDAQNAHLFPLQIDPKLRDMVSEDIAQTRYSIPVVYNERVVQSINFFQTGERREKFAAGLARSGKYLPMIRTYFREAGIPSEVIYMAMVESLFNPYALSRVRARGIWQFMAPTGKSYGLRVDGYIDERCDPERSTQAAVRHTLDLYRQFGDWQLVMAAYNVGAGAMQRAIDRARTRNFWELAARGYLPRETASHIPLIMAAILIAHNPEKYGFSSELSPPLNLDKVALGHPVSLSVVGKLTGLSVEELKELNPELRGAGTPPNYPEYQLKLPQGVGAGLQTKLAAIPVSAWLLKSDRKRPSERMARTKGKRRGAQTEVAASRSRRGKKNRDLAESDSVSAKTSRGKPITHKVRKGDSLTSIAARYNTDVASVRSWNHLPSKKIRPGDKITIYLRD